MDVPKIQITADEMVSMLIKGWVKMIKLLEEVVELRDLKQEVMDQVLVEFLIYYLFDIDTVLKLVFPDEEEHARMFNAIQAEIVHKLTKRDDLLLIMGGNVNKMDFSPEEKVKYVQEPDLLVNFQEMVDKRLKEYYSYAVDLEKDGTPIVKNKAHVACIKRIVALVKNDSPDTLWFRVWELSLPQLLDFQLAFEQKGVDITGNFIWGPLGKAW